MATDDGVHPRKRRVTVEQRRALQLLACSPFGAAEAIMLTQGFTVGTLAGLVRAGLATAQRETVYADSRSIGGRVRTTLGVQSKADRHSLAPAQAQAYPEKQLAPATEVELGPKRD